MEKCKRYVVFLIGLIINSIGIAVITMSSLGISPISSIPNVLALEFTKLTLGNFTILFSLLLILIQLVILGKNFRLEHVLQIPVSIILGYLIDACMLVFSFIKPELYWQQLLCLLVGCVILGAGVYLESVANGVMRPGESVVRAICLRLSSNFGSTKMAVDVSLAVIAVVLSFLFFGRLEGVREGTIIAALLVGFIARQLGKHLNALPLRLAGINA